MTNTITTFVGNENSDKIKSNRMKVIENRQTQKINNINKPLENKIVDNKIRHIRKMNINKYETRDISWLKFNERILHLSNANDIPLLERLKFLSITSSNLDEFTMVRMANLLEKEEDDPDKLSIMGTTPRKEYKYLRDRIYKFLSQQNKSLDKILIELQAQGILLVKSKKELTDKSKKYLKNYFEDKVQSLLTPLVFDNARPFPLIKNNTLHIGVIINNEGNDIFGTIEVPNIDRLIEVKGGLPDEIREFILLEDLIQMNLDKIFVNKNISKSCVYRVLRNFDYSVSGSTNVFLADEIKETLKRRQVNDIIRLDISGSKKEFTKVLYKAMHINKNCINKTDGIIDPTFGFSMANIRLSDKEQNTLLYKKFKPQVGIDVLDEFDIFDRIDKDDIILHHPYESYDTVIDFITKASEDRDVVAIKQTLYRVSDNSPIMKALVNAAENGKHVTVLLEIKARFDEENNIQWANKLEAAGGHVIYGVPGKKTHCKVCLIVKKTKKGNLEKYAHIGTGNYNEKNARTYTDISLFTNKKNIVNEIEQLFNYLTGFSSPDMKKILFADTIYSGLIKLINNEIENCKAGKPCGIDIKVNSLTDKSIIDKLYEAANVGVPINLIVRSACGLTNPNKNIKIKSIVGRFLEHSRIYHFINGNTDKDIFYISSSDLMERNLYSRVELAVPVIGKAKERIRNIMEVYKKDDSCFIMDEYGKYNKSCGSNVSQEEFIKIAEENNSLENITKIFTRLN